MSRAYWDKSALLSCLFWSRLDKLSKGQKYETFILTAVVITLLVVKQELLYFDCRCSSASSRKTKVATQEVIQAGT